MPYTNVPPDLWDKMDRCVKDVVAKSGLEKPNAIAICHKSIMNASDKATWVTVEEMREICIPCAEKMQAKGIQRVNLAELLKTSEILVDPTAGGKMVAAFQAAQAMATENSKSERVAFDSFGSQSSGAKSWSQPFRILPIGKWYRDDRVLDITDKVAEEIVLHFKEGLPRYGVNINVEHEMSDNQPGRVGQVTDLQYVRGDGVYAQVTFTAAGTTLVDEERYTAVSPELIWSQLEGSMYQDPKTGTWHDNVLVGLALTTAPYFGKEVAVFSAKPQEKTPANTGDSGALVEQLAQSFSQILTALRENFGKGGTTGAAKKGHQIVRTKDETVDPENTDPPESLSGGNMDKLEIKPEEFAALQQKVVALETARATEVASLTAQLKKAEEMGQKLAADVAAEQRLRLVVEFRDKAESFSSIPTKTDDLTTHLLWLSQADSSEKKDHYAYFENLLKTVNEAMAQSVLFQVQSSNRVDPNVAQDPFLQKVEELRKEQFGKLPYAEGFSQAWRLAGTQFKDLARVHALQTRGGNNG